jgi:multiple sugar transport system ATP-binding protein
MTMADKIVVLNAGRIEQVGSPIELYSRPDNLFVAGFIGSPKMNLISGPLADQMHAKTIGIRPEHLRLSRNGGNGAWPGMVQVAEHLGSDTFLYVDVAGAGLLTVRAEGEHNLSPGDTAHLAPDPARIHRFDANGAAIR